MLYVLLLIVVLLFPAFSAAQSGILLRDDCSSITSPTAGQTYCFDRTANELKRFFGIRRHGKRGSRDEPGLPELRSDKLIT